MLAAESGAQGAQELVPGRRAGGPESDPWRQSGSHSLHSATFPLGPWAEGQAGGGSGRQGGRRAEMIINGTPTILSISHEQSHLTEASRGALEELGKGKVEGGAAEPREGP